TTKQSNFQTIFGSFDYLNQSYFTPLSYKDQLISREQAQILGSIRRII
ncbi:unnamed protein product, partial [Rotaria socialis]